MRRSTKVLAGVSAVVLALSTAGVLAASAGAAPAVRPFVTCSISWATATSGSWTDSALWSPARVPTSSDDVCISINGTYTVTLNGSAAVDSVTLGGTSGSQTLLVQGNAANGAATLSLTAGGSIGTKGTFTMDSTNGNYALVSGATITNKGTFQTIQDAGGVRYLRAPLSNSSTGKVTIGSNDTTQDSGTTDTNAGSFTVASGGVLSLSGTCNFTNSTGGTLTATGSFTESGGTFTENGTESGSAVTLISATLADSAGTGSFVLEGGNSLSGTIPAGQTVTVLGSATEGGANTTMSAAVTNNGTLSLDSNNGNFAELTGAGTLTNNGILKSAATAGGTRYLRVNLVNSAGGTVEITEPGTLQDQGTTDTNDGTFNVGAAGTLTLSGSSVFTNSGGSLGVNGSFSQSGGTFSQSGTESGNPVVLIGATLADASGSGSFDLESSDSLSGTIPAGQTVTVLGSGAEGSADTTMNVGVTNNGTLSLDSDNGNYAILSGSGTLTNNGTLESAASAGGARYLRVNFVNSAGGTVEIAEPGTVADQALAETNNGTFTVDTSGTLGLSGGATFTNNAGGSLSVSGSFSESGGTFTQSGGTETGNPAVLISTTLADSAGTGSFDLQGSNTLSGTIPTGQTVTVLGSGAQGNAVVSITGTVTNDGTLAMSSSNGNYSVIQGSSTPTLSNSGLFQLAQGAGGNRYLRVNVTNNSGGTFDVGSNGVVDDQGYAISNNGLLTVDDGAQLPISGGGSFTNGSSGTFSATVDATNGTFGITGGTDSLAGTLQIVTVGSPALSSTHTPISGATVTGTFSGLQYGANEYATAYSASAVTLTTGTPFTMTAKTIHAVDETPAKLSLATVTDPAPTAPYTVSVNWGDNTTSAGTFTATGTGGTAKGTHTWTAPGHYTVVTTVHAADGTTISVSKAITVTAAPVPTVTSVSPTFGVQGKSVTLTLNGTGFTVNSVPSFSNPGISVTSTTWVSTSELTVKIAISATAVPGAGNVTVTTPGGAGTCTGCFTVDALPTITRAHPDPVHGSTTTVTVTGTGFQSGLTVTTTITGATLGAPTGVTATSFTIAVTVPAGTAPGSYKISVTNPDGGKATHKITVT